MSSNANTQAGISAASTSNSNQNQPAAAAASGAADAAGGNVSVPTTKIRMARQGLRDVGGSQFTPKKVSIGVYHRGLHSDSDKNKEGVADRMCPLDGARRNRLLDELTNNHLRRSNRGRDWYPDIAQSTVDSYFSFSGSRMPLLDDGCYVLHFLVEYEDERGVVIKDPWRDENENLVMRDIVFLLENQIPWSVLREMHRRIRRNDSHSDSDSDSDSDLDKELAHRVPGLLEKRLYTIRGEGRRRPLLSSPAPTHLLDLVHHYFKPTAEQPRAQRAPTVPEATAAPSAAAIAQEATAAPSEAATAPSAPTAAPSVAATAPLATEAVSAPTAPEAASTLSTPTAASSAAATTPEVDAALSAPTTAPSEAATTTPEAAAAPSAAATASEVAVALSPPTAAPSAAATAPEASPASSAAAIAPEAAVAPSPPTAVPSVAATALEAAVTPSPPTAAPSAAATASEATVAPSPPTSAPSAATTASEAAVAPSPPTSAPSTTATAPAAASSREPEEHRVDISMSRWRRATEYRRYAFVKLKRRDFKQGVVESVLDVSLDGRTLWIPTLRIDELTCTILRNLIAFEDRMRMSQRPVTAYCLFMSQLACKVEDVELLQRLDILQNFLPTDEDVVKGFRDLCKGVVFEVDDPEMNYLNGTWHKLHKRCQAANTFFGLIRERHCSNSVRGAAHCAAILLFVFQAVQVAFAVLSHFQKSH
ncbi:unnamed protein product [Miscanthus lutarioriparius]|uniref:Uncharacterized protein n=1 Tax=Miscanthus lutarioriparius TaxID=422564 RepID=A0A811SIU2_9POAL|nr:unnamed protein product [Miscanthus lutarioriparius]